MENQKILAQMRRLAKTGKYEDVADLQGLAAHLRELEAFNPREVRLLVDAVKADVLEDLSAPGEGAVRGLLHERLANRIISESDASHEEARWAVQTWAKTLSGKSAEVSHMKTNPTSLSWDKDDVAPAPKLSDLRTSAPPAASSNALPASMPAPAKVPSAQPAASAAWPPPALSYVETAGDENTSGTEGPLPPEIAALKWHWGAFAISFWWLRYHNLRAWGWWLLLISFVLRLNPFGSLVSAVGILAVCIALGLNGHKLAWQKRRYDSVQQYFDTESKWTYWGIFCTVIGFGINLLVFGMALTGTLHGTGH